MGFLESINNFFNRPEKTQDPVSPKPTDNKSVSVRNPRGIYNLYTDDFSGLNGDQLKYYLETARKGVNYFKSLLFEEIKRRDSHMGGVIQTRKLSILSHSYTLDCDSDQDLDKYKEIIKSFNFENFLTDLVEASIQGVSTFEITYKNIPGLGTVPVTVDLLPNHLLLYDDPSQDYKILDIDKTDMSQIRAISSNSIQDYIPANSFPLVDIHPLKLLFCHSFDGNSPNGFLNGCTDSLLWIYLFKSYGVKDWASYIEKFGIPIRKGSFQPGIKPSDKEKLVTALSNFGNSQWMIHPDTVSVDLISESQKSQSSDLYSVYTVRWDDQISIRVLGQTQTTQLSGTGSYASAKVHNTVRQDLINADKILASRSVNELLSRIQALNGLAPVTFKYDEIDSPEEAKSKAETKEIKSKVYLNLHSLGLKANIEEISEDLNMDLAPLETVPMKNPVPPDQGPDHIDDPEEPEIPDDPDDPEDPESKSKFEEATDSLESELNKLIEETWHTAQRQIS